MRYAVVSDIHANLEAWNAVVTDALSSGVDRFLCLGDLIGYGPRPSEIIADVRKRADVVVMGNHDAVACGLFDASVFNPTARGVIEWTIDQLSEDDRQYLASLPLDAQLDGLDILLVHSDAVEPGRFDYLHGKTDARACFDACDDGLIFVGHTHHPCIFALSPDGVVSQHQPGTFTREAGFRYIVNPGSVGDPRCEDIAATYCIYDTDEQTITYRRVEFSVDVCRADYAEVGLNAKPYFLRFLDRQVTEPEQVACFDDSKPRPVVRKVDPTVPAAAPAPNRATPPAEVPTDRPKEHETSPGPQVDDDRRPTKRRRDRRKKSIKAKRTDNGNERREDPRESVTSITWSVIGLCVVLAFALGLTIGRYVVPSEASETGPQSSATSGSGDLGSARYVRISLPRSGTLSLAEVEIISSGVNVALNQSASQSSTHPLGDAANAVDGNTNGHFDEGSASQTSENQPGPWWEVDLGETIAIDSVRVWNREDGGAPKMRRLHNFTLEFYDDDRNLAFARHKISASSRTIDVE